jgi:hypothetical protein
MTARWQRSVMERCAQSCSDESRLLSAPGSKDLTWSRSKDRLLLEPIEISVCLVAAELILEGIDSLAALQTIKLLLQAGFIGLPLDPLQLLLIFEALRLLIGSQLVELTLYIEGFSALRRRKLGMLLIDQVEIVLKSIDLVVAPNIFQILLPL